MPVDVVMGARPSNPGESGAASTPATGKRKRSGDEPAEAGPSNLKRARTVLSRPLRPKRANDWHLKKKEVPENAGKTKTALELHLRALWMLTHQNAIPPKVTQADKEVFAARFSSEAQVKTSVSASLDQHTGNINEASARVQTLTDTLVADSTISNNIKRISEGHLLVIFRSLANLGLRRWAPDILSDDPESMYNLLHEHIALKTFEQVSISYAYSHVGNDLSFINNFSLMRKLYRSFVYGYMVKLAKLEAKSPGGVVRSNETTNVYKRRADLANGRVETIKAQAFNKHVLALAEEPEAHSDDEIAPNTTMIVEGEEGHQVYHIKEKWGRAAKAKSFYRLLDRTRRRIVQGKKKLPRPERLRKDPSTPQPSNLTTLPKGVPLDWFEPSVWNYELTICERADYTKDGIYIALPLEEYCDTWEKISLWKNLPHTEFMERFGNDVLKLYTLPTPQELEQLKQCEEEDEMDDVFDQVNTEGSEEV